MKNLFYSNKEKLLFWVPGYDISSLKAVEISTYLLQKASEFCTIFEGNLNTICTYVIYDSRRYRGMRVFYEQTENIPEGAFELNDNWTMNEWLTD